MKNAYLTPTKCTLCSSKVIQLSINLAWIPAYAGMTPDLEWVLASAYLLLPKKIWPNITIINSYALSPAIPHA